jgi:hypothetical protein
MSNEPLTDEQVDQANAAQLARALGDTKQIWDALDGKGLDLEGLAALPDPRSE